MNHLTDLSCTAFADALAAKASVPGGGGAAALTGALAIALCSMAGNFTAGKKKYASVEEDVQRILAQCEALRIQLLDLVDADAKAFEPLSKAYAIPRDDPSRAQVMEEATLIWGTAPIHLMSSLSRLLISSPHLL